ncbi:twin-arginine translocation signal domain-containing protein [Candidatus Dojkabacteria bacterium]|nr:twin-arginine translocation signal domain-containing protein [Candidatus Dojkabacteria bacterium]
MAKGLTRRSFLNMSGVAAAATALSAFPGGRPVDAADPLRQDHTEGPEFLGPGIGRIPMDGFLEFNENEAEIAWQQAYREFIEETVPEYSSLYDHLLQSVPDTLTIGNGYSLTGSSLHIYDQSANLDQEIPGFESLKGASMYTVNMKDDHYGTPIEYTHSLAVWEPIGVSRQTNVEGSIIESTHKIQYGEDPDSMPFTWTNYFIEYPSIAGRTYIASAIPAGVESEKQLLTFLNNNNLGWPNPGTGPLSEMRVVSVDYELDNLPAIMKYANSINGDVGLGGGCEWVEAPHEKSIWVPNAIGRYDGVSGERSVEVKPIRETMNVLLNTNITG